MAMTLKDFRTGKRLASFKYAFRGIAALFRTQPNAIIHLIITILVIIAGVIFHISEVEWLAVIIVTGLVFSAEMFNSAVETVVDIVSPHYSKKAGEAKDLAAGAVLVSAIIAAIAGIVIFLPKIVKLFF